MRSIISVPLILMGVFSLMGCQDQSAEQEGDQMASIDQGCFDQCIAKNVSEAECMSYCDTSKGDGAQGDEGGKGSKGPKDTSGQNGAEDGIPEGNGESGDPNESLPADGSGTASSNGQTPDDSNPDTPDADDGMTPSEDEPKPDREEQIRTKGCVECWYDQDTTGGACADEVQACEDSLACTQLQWCPSLCDRRDCIDDCNEIIPSGVPILTAVVQCLVCDGGPCSESCADTPMETYCD